MSNTNKPICSICQLDIERDDSGRDGTNNAEPVNDGWCCNSCDIKVVFPARLNQIGRYNDKEKTDENIN